MLSSESPGSVSVPCNANAFDTLNIDNPTNQTATSLQTSPGGPGIAVPPERRGESDLSLSDSTQSTQLAYSSQPPAPYTFPYGDDLVQPLGRDQRTDQQGIVSHLNFPLQAVTLEGLLSSRLTSPTPPRVRWFTAQCSLPDCMNPAFFDQTEQEQRDYCLEHISFALSSGFAAPCQRCGRLPARLASSFCGKGCDGAQLLRQVPHRQAAAKDVLTTGRPDVSSDVGTYYEGLFIHDSWG
ncbi:hypothetical protein BC826DRAFT_1030308 [Russula brevipes]|nr:hypothetical protein BC826DRAFT_1030308 [Russula brevipes]